mgnify:CR=1 FL=1
MDSRVAQAMRLLEEQMTDSIDHVAIAAQVGLSRYRLHHLFLEETGETPGGYLRRIRVDLAAMRLRWTRETVGEVAHGLGYASQGSFNRAFADRFGTSPSRFRKDHEHWPHWPTAHLADRRVTVHERESLTCFARRYFGPLAEIEAKWQDFLGRLPDRFAAAPTALFIGCTYDDPRFTPASQIRYDCCITGLPAMSAGVVEGTGLHLQSTRPGLYAALEHRGDYSETIGSSYSMILDNWASQTNRYTMADDPALEVYRVPPGRAQPGELACSILVPLI